MDREVVIHLYEYYSAIKEEMLPLWQHGWNLRSFIPSETSETEDDKYYMTSFICGIWRNWTQKERIDCCLPAQKWGLRGMGAVGQRVQTFIYKMSKFWGSNMQHDDYNW